MTYEVMEQCRLEGEAIRHGHDTYVPEDLPPHATPVRTAHMPDACWLQRTEWDHGLNIEKGSKPF